MPWSKEGTRYYVATKDLRRYFNAYCDARERIKSPETVHGQPPYAHDLADALGLPTTAADEPTEDPSAQAYFEAVDAMRVMAWLLLKPRVNPEKHRKIESRVFEPYIVTSVLQEALAQWKGEPTQSQVLELVADLVSSCGLAPALVRNVIEREPAQEEPLPF